MKSKQLTNWKLFVRLVLAEWRSRDQSSFAGFMMTLFSPLLSWCIIYAFLGPAFEKYQSGYGTFLLVGLVMWGFFSRATSAGMSSALTRREWLRSMSVPFWIVVLSPVAAVFGAFCLESVLVLLLVSYLNGMHGAAIFAGYCVAAVLLLLVCSGLALLLSVANVFIRDTPYLWGIVSRIAFFATPIFYPEVFVGRRISWLQLNPLTHVFRLARSGVGESGVLALWSVGYAVLFALIVFAVGAAVAHGLKQRVAEVV
ncbi:MAG: ABC transporter permease [Bdellovibrionales bacterium]|nr:ABC transporter permease [Bdellovibrionales bacterium]